MRLEITWKLISRIHFWTRVDILDTCLKRMRIQMFWIPVRKKNTYPVVLDTYSKTNTYPSRCSCYIDAIIRSAAASACRTIPVDDDIIGLFRYKLHIRIVPT